MFHRKNTNNNTNNNYNATSSNYNNTTSDAGKHQGKWTSSETETNFNPQDTPQSDWNVNVDWNSTNNRQANYGSSGYGNDSYGNGRNTSSYGNNASSYGYGACPDNCGPNCTSCGKNSYSTGSSSWGSSCPDNCGPNCTSCGKNSYSTGSQWRNNRRGMSSGMPSYGMSSSGMSSGSTTGWGSQQVPCDVWETRHHYIAEIDLPGCHADCIDVKVVGTTLYVTANRNLNQKASRHYLVNERHGGEMVRKLNLPPNCGHSQVRAEIANGVLRVHIPIVTGFNSSSSQWNNNSNNNYNNQY